MSTEPTTTSSTSDSRPGLSWQVGVRSLQFKASVLAVALVTVVIGVATALSSRTMSSAFYDGEFARAHTWAKSLASRSSEAVAERDREYLTHTVNDLIRTHGVAYLALSDTTGQVLASGEMWAGLLTPMLPDGATLELGEMDTPRLIELSHRRITCADVSVPVYADEPVRRSDLKLRGSRRIVGYLRLATDVSGTQAQLERVSRQIWRIGLGLGLLAVPCSLLVTRYVIAPLNELARAARAIADGATDARAHVDSHDEVGELARSFNTMADRLTRSRVELLELNAELEERVQQRTRELEELAARDPLTNLYNRRHFREVMAREFAAAERYDADLTCLMLDLDQFKEINDHFGHRAGDEVLIGLAEAIAGELRGADVAARFGGDEFIVLLPQTSASAAASLVDRIEARFVENVRARLPEVPGEVSVGVASLRMSQSPSAEALIHEADVALYAAKEGRRELQAAARHAPAVH